MYVRRLPYTLLPIHSTIHVNTTLAPKSIMLLQIERLLFVEEIKKKNSTGVPQIQIHLSSIYVKL